MEPEGGWQENVRVWVRKADTSRGLGQEPRRVPKKKKKRLLPSPMTVTTLSTAVGHPVTAIPG